MTPPCAGPLAAPWHAAVNGLQSDLAAFRKATGHNRGVGLLVRVLGPLAVERSDAPVATLSPKLRVVLALLTANRGGVVSTDRLCEALWADDQPAAALATLQSHLSRLRRLLEPDAQIVGTDGGYRLDLPGDLLDADRFGSLAREAAGLPDAAAAARGYGAALEWWRGPAFGELAESDWTRAEAVRLDELRVHVAEEWMERRLAAGGDATLIADLEAWCTQHPLRERFRRQLLVALFRTGRHGEALRRANEFRTLLRDEMGLDPSIALAELEGRILAEDPTLLVAPRADRSPPWAARAVLDDPTPLVGRAVELSSVIDAVATNALVTLVGPGGVGKTRLARRAATTVAGFEHGVTFVELAAVSEPDSLVDAVATALDVQPRQHLSMEDALVVALAERHQLVVLDNCEHVLDTLVPLVDRLRSRCPRLHVLATSREALGLPGEMVSTVAPLVVAAPDVDDPSAIARSPAVALLLERVTAAVPGFTVTAANAPVLSEICRRLDGLPLALELVAARFRSLSPETILQRLVLPSVVLGASMRSANPRHRTLRDTVAWSFGHLSRAEQTLFARLSAFAGSFDLAAVEAVCGSVIDPLDGDDELTDVVGVLAMLVDKSMVQLVNPERGRYQLLETLREFGREQLRELGATDLVDDAHLRWFTAVAERATTGITGPEEAVWSHRIEADIDNARVAFGRAVRTGDTDAALRLVVGLREFAFRRIRYELTAWATTCLGLPGAADHALYPVLLGVVGYGHYVRGDLEESVAVGLLAVAASDSWRDSSGLAERALANAYFYLGQTDEALAWMDRMLRSARQGSPARLAHALYMRSVAETSMGRTVPGAILAGEARAVARTSGSPTARAQAAYALGLALEGSDPEQSLLLLRESAEVAGAAGNRWIEAFAQTEVWWLEARNGDVHAALTGSGAVIDTWHRGGDWVNLHLSLRRVFGLLLQLGDHAAAAVLYGALKAAGATSALPFEPTGAEDLEGAVDVLGAALGRERLDAEVARGADLSDAALVTFVQDRIARRGAPALGYRRQP